MIEVSAGNYAIDATLTYNGTTNSALTIEGGYFFTLQGSCSTQSSDPALTVLDGEGSRTIMNLRTFGAPITVKYLTFQHSLGVSDVSGASALFAGQIGTDAGKVDVSNNIFSGNTLTQGSAVVHVETQGDISVLNNALVDNVLNTGDGLNLYAAGAATSTAVNNNTISGNTCAAGTGGTAPGTAAIVETYGSQMGIANNIVYGNAGCANDLYLNAGSAQASFTIDNNDLGDTDFPNDSGSAVTEAANQTVDPGFVAGSFTLSPSSTLINSGKNAATGGVGTTDAAGKPRIVFNEVDIGAFELQDDIFKDGFE